MKKIINGKTYNTETATALGFWDNGCAYNDFQYCAETLYRTAKGAYFLHGEGGPMSCYSRSRGQNEWSGGEGISLLPESEARIWMEDHCSADAYEEAFGVAEEG